MPWTQKQKGMFGAELKRRKSGSSSQLPNLATKKLRTYLSEPTRAPVSKIKKNKNASSFSRALMR